VEGWQHAVLTGWFVGAGFSRPRAKNNVKRAKNNVKSRAGRPRPYKKWVHKMEKNQIFIYYNYLNIILGGIKT